MKVREALVLLKKEGITKSEQQLRKWIRSGEINATRSANRKAGYQVDQKSLQKFIQNRKPVKTYHQEIEQLKKEIAILKKENIQLQEHLNITESNVTKGNKNKIKEEIKFLNQHVTLLQDEKVEEKKKYKEEINRLEQRLARLPRGNKKKQMCMATAILERLDHVRVLSSSEKRSRQRHLEEENITAVGMSDLRLHLTEQELTFLNSIVETLELWHYDTLPDSDPMFKKINVKGLNQG